MKTQLDYIKLGKTLVAAAMLSVLLAFVAVPRSQADDRGKCQHSAERAQAKLNDAIARYGGNSQQAINRWHQLNAVRQQCWNQQGGKRTLAHEGLLRVEASSRTTNRERRDAPTLGPYPRCVKDLTPGHLGPKFTILK